MIDICLCVGDSCPLKQDCRRWDVNTPCTPDCIGQSYFWRVPWKEGKCEYFEPMAKKLNSGKKE